MFAHKRNTEIKHLANERGMTLIEIMIVIAIIAGLMAVLGNSVTNSLKRSRVENTKLQIKELSKQVEQYNLACNAYPQSLEGLLKHPGNDVCANWGPDPYVKPAALKDQWGNPFIYTAEGSGYEIKSLGADKAEAGEGYNRDLSSNE